ncbi:DNA cytosine methyltransferase [Bacteroidales bacterium MB20-C3-3]|nr:DNA cytosine methyltransferase [Bacteroidales bacterium MB20-C3-3]
MNQENIKLLYIDLFSGAGGTSTGVEFTQVNGQKCARVVACVNHDINAILSHSENHPETLHFTEDIRTLELSPMVTHLNAMRVKYPEALVVLWASLECTNFSKAKGGQSRDADSRTLAEHLFRYIDAIDPDFVHIENVEEFMSWGDVDENGKPISMDRGRSYLRWVKNICKYGYSYDWKICNSADYGAYTARKRYFGQFAKKGLPISWPEPTHAKVVTGGGLFGRLERWKAVKEVLDLKDEGESIFTRKKPLSEKTLERIYAGLIKFVAGGKDKWILKYNSINGKTGKHIPPSIEEPSPVISCQGRLGIVSANFLSAYYGNGDNVSDIESPSPVVTTKDRLALISSQFLYSYNFKDAGKDINAPCPTLLTKDRLALATPQFLDMQYGNGSPAPIDTPAGTVTTSPKHNLVTLKPWIMNTNFNNVGASVDEPSQVITANRKWHYLMNTTLADGNELYIKVFETDTPAMVRIKEFMALYGIIDIKMRMLKIPELKQIMGFPKTYKLIGTQAEQKKYIGNAVEVNMSRALCAALAEDIYKYELEKVAI